MSSTHFGFQSVDETEKASRVREVFDSVAPKYDLMNDLMSAGLHRVWKRYTTLVANVREGQHVLDIAAGTGDLTRSFARSAGRSGLVVHTDINEAMLRAGRDRLLDEGVVVPSMVCDAEALPFADESFDLVSVAFGLRNMTHKDKALAEMCRVLKPRGKLLVLEFSKVAKPLEKAYDWYSFKVLPRIGKVVAGDDASYRYLAESIRMHPDQQALKGLMQAQGFGHVDYHNMTGGMVALHVGIKC
ncbi:bifunctional demethylmenaquinone methyltransferase/2-methoxy-6-polyprenyl-1,4-benzoquinol methylase UbiE [Pseudorhodoferax sp. Leaf265]|jgi:demethylmenaquinone methyltransferase/2-methoxy-6-polyprenyl-1,4-benzoquinol methylase|uniref:bifunctional demethylmenaquinone methyltransferase/2-methoxy-6-polyprenyl-1,4-benzoquinol methylase UbiE n=1 Tax=Pseudorhodoferax sp. Leaf265 TaxID=1736315 RepID=UPI0006FF439A|nr:bifunctional demethylmenaquinone methyltransferase/2-methoxy-6-polyprenyl-1,4-benzoquinol methylase UbiE [Pseudorhodoferax sp. Leaf265]KQP21142.1 ubiquinone biosynthesis methyltransferase UbiE [Pseudorhodoferax sp. Leaf265]PZP95729.1 MAG: bifunctional demethylmenaquinone methyltransferase/2-methoxy-6-polyprenyl-1,4-benzoquinol methylase UbiE [Variovorax paradoxus]PZQ06683.1 MAG: bifunctional demethylmenaquinone methyltransferase/2-methoxy-6-polyprenyl-1,4-benzoquinol methylase UbiE [Variovora